MKLLKKFARNSMTSESFTVKDWVTLVSVAYLGYGRHGTCHGRHFNGAQKLLGKIKIFIYSFLNLYFAPHAFINCKVRGCGNLTVMQIIAVEVVQV